MSFTVILRGYKLPVVVLDAFLSANGLPETYGYPPLSDKEQHISELLKAKMGVNDHKACVFIPKREAFNESAIAYIAYTWVKVFAQREINLKQDLPEEVPPSFNNLIDEIVGYEQGDIKNEMGLFVLFTGRTTYTPDILVQRNQPPVHCDACDQTFQNFANRQVHRMEVHGSTEGENPLPEA